MENLSSKHKKEFEKQIRNISDNDELKVLKEIDGEIEKLKKIYEKGGSHKIEGLIENAEFLTKILKDKDFPLPESTKKWIVFGLGYLISDIDLIPDIIPVIGYNDDALILQWVMHMIDDDINRYIMFQKARNVKEPAEVVKQPVQGSGDTLVVVVPGFLNEAYDSDYFKHWSKKIRDAGEPFSNAGIAIVDWNIAHLKEFSKIIRIIDHRLNLKPVYDFEKFNAEWKQLKMEFAFLGKALAVFLENIHKKYPGKEVIVVSFNAGNFAVETALKILPEGYVSRYFSFGGAMSNTDMPFFELRKVNRIYNYFSFNDYALKFIFDNFEEEAQAVGLSPYTNPSAVNVENFNVSESISNHFEYKFKLSDFLKI